MDGPQTSDVPQSQPQPPSVGGREVENEVFRAGPVVSFFGHSWRTIAHDFCSVWYLEQFIDCPLPVHNETCQQNLPIEVCDRCGAVRRNVSGPRPRTGGLIVSVLQTPAADASASEWGRLAVSIPGSPACWADLDGVDGHDAPGAVCADGTWWLTDSADGMYLDVDHPATAGCFLELLGPCEIGHDATDPTCGPWSAEIPGVFRMGTTAGRAMIAVAAAYGRWPGGEG